MIPEFSILTTDRGEQYPIRPMRATDVPLLIEIFGHLSAESRYRRFNQPLNDPDPDLIQRSAEQMADVDADEGAAWLIFADTAEGDDRPIGGSRYMFNNPDDHSEAEVAITVRDDFQNRGIGKALLRFTAEQALAAGVKRFTGLVQAENDSMWALLHKLGLRYERDYDGPFVNIVVYLDEQTDPPPD